MEKARVGRRYRPQSLGLTREPFQSAASRGASTHRVTGGTRDGHRPGCTKHQCRARWCLDSRVGPTRRSGRVLNARRADRVAYASHDVLITLTASAAVTRRIRLSTNVLLGPTRNPILLAKQTATLDRISRGRFILGIAIGGREDDFVAAGQPFHKRGKRWTASSRCCVTPGPGKPLAPAREPLRLVPPTARRCRFCLAVGRQRPFAARVAGVSV